MSDGGGTVGYTVSTETVYDEESGEIVEVQRICLYAVEEEGMLFIGWFNEAGELISTERIFDCTDCAETVLIARFVKANLGDVDRSGKVTILDAVLALRNAMSIMTFDDAQKVIGDVNFDGNITILDAVLILRYAMGVITEF